MSSISITSEKLDGMFNAERELVLKMGAMVVLLKNINTKLGLVNGMTGIVTDFDEVVCILIVLV